MIAITRMTARAFERSTCLVIVNPILKPGARSARVSVHLLILPIAYLSLRDDARFKGIDGLDRVLTLLP
jgi:hypothetical protein